MAAAKKYVIAHGVVAGWYQGEVITEKEIKEKGADLDRLLELEAIREATKEEAKLSKVTVVNGAIPSLSHEQANAELKLKADRFAKENERLRGELDKAKGELDKGSDEKLTARISELEAEGQKLGTENVELKDDVETLQKKLEKAEADLEQEKAKKK